MPLIMLCKMKNIKNSKIIFILTLIKTVAYDYFKAGIANAI